METAPLDKKTRRYLSAYVQICVCLVYILGFELSVVTMFGQYTLALLQQWTVKCPQMRHARAISKYNIDSVKAISKTIVGPRVVFFSKMTKKLKLSLQ